MGASDKIVENRLRNVARRRGLGLRKSRRRDPYASDFGMFYVVDARNVLVAECTDLDDVEAVLNDVAQRDRDGRPRVRYA